ncbi:glycosyltransferase family 2 protein [Siphonobacter sp.]|uniref:glycosyltransferase family 2 protein n=1 Tax=Siphonobacter sp. TaxID=1869184 RepID=UPI003B3A8BAC
MDISVIIPVYKSETTIAPLVERILSTLRTYRMEIVLVNDGSPDHSEAICTELAERFQHVKFISLRRNFGEFNAVMCGLHYATGRYCVMVDDDFQNPPSEILKLVAEAERGQYDVVYSYYQTKQHSLFRNTGSWVVNQMTTRLLDKPRDLYLSSFKLIRQEVVREMIRYTGPYPYLDGLIFRVTRNVGKVAVEHHKREGGSSYTLRKLISLFLNILFCYSPRPIRLVTNTGFVLILLSILGSLTELATSFLSKHLPETDHLIWLTVIFLGGIQLIGLGLVGEYIGKIFMTQNGLPQFVVKKTILPKEIFS